MQSDSSPTQPQHPVPHSTRPPSWLRLGLLCLLLNVSVNNTLQAGLLASSTRVIFDQQEHEKSLIIANTNPYPVLSQVWVDDGSNQVDYPDAPFVLLPAVFKISAAEVKALRIVYNGLALPTDRESVYWLNLYEIPALTSEARAAPNQLHMAMNTQLKIFYRPTALKPMSITAIATALNFQKLNLQTATATTRIRVSNPSPYHVTLLDVAISNSTQRSSLYSAEQMIAPFSERDFTLQQADFDLRPPLTLHYILIDDAGKSQVFEKSWAAPLFLSSTNPPQITPQNR